MAITIPAKQCYTVYIYIYAQQNPRFFKTIDRNKKKIQLSELNVRLYHLKELGVPGRSTKLK